MTWIVTPLTSWRTANARSAGANAMTGMVTRVISASVKESLTSLTRSERMFWTKEGIMRTVALSKELFDFWEDAAPGWVCLLGLDQEADEKVIFLMEAPKAEESRRVAGEHGGVNIVINDEQVVVSAPNGKEGP